MLFELLFIGSPTLSQNPEYENHEHQKALKYLKLGSIGALIDTDNDSDSALIVCLTV